MDQELYDKKRKRAPRAPTPRIGDVRVSKVALATLRPMRDNGAVVLATRRFPHDFTFQLYYPDGSKGADQLTDALVDTLVRTRLIETDSVAATVDTKVYRITQRGRDALDGIGFDLVEEQLPLIEGV